jgi:hypothetical protein
MARKQLTEIDAAVADATQLQADAELARLRAEVASYRKRYKAALAQIDRERERADSMLSLQGVKPVRPRVTCTAKSE